METAGGFGGGGEEALPPSRDARAGSTLARQGALLLLPPPLPARFTHTPPRAMVVSRHVAARPRAGLALKGAGSGTAAAAAAGGGKRYGPVRARLPPRPLPRCGARFAEGTVAACRGGVPTTGGKGEPRPCGACSCPVPPSPPRGLTPQRALPPGRRWQMAAPSWLRGCRYSSHRKAPLRTPPGLARAGYQSANAPSRGTSGVSWHGLHVPDALCRAAPGEVEPAGGRLGRVSRGARLPVG